MAPLGPASSSWSRCWNAQLQEIMCWYTSAPHHCREQMGPARLARRKRHAALLRDGPVLKACGAGISYRSLAQIRFARHDGFEHGVRSAPLSHRRTQIDRRRRRARCPPRRKQPQARQLDGAHAVATRSPFFAFAPHRDSNSFDRLRWGVGGPRWRAGTPMLDLSGLAVVEIPYCAWRLRRPSSCCGLSHLPRQPSGVLRVHGRYLIPGPSGKFGNGRCGVGSPRDL